MSALPLILATHITLAILLFLPSILLPFALRRRRPATESANPVVRSLIVVQSRGTFVVGLGLALTGAALLAVLGTDLLRQPWLLLALLIYATNLVVAFFIQRPSLQRLIGVRTSADDRLWRDRARRQRYLSYAMAGLVGTIAYLMSAKPVLW